MILFCLPQLKKALINILNCWTVKWRMKVNVQKSNIIHFRKKSQKQTTFNFKLGSFPLSIISEYKYLGFFLQEHLDFNVGVRYLTDAASRATGALISKFKTLKNVGFGTFKKLYFAGVAPIWNIRQKYGDTINLVRVTKYKTELLDIFWVYINLHLPLG